MESQRVASSEPYLNVAVDYLNVLLRDENYWTKPELLKSRIQIGFNKALSKDELDEDYDLRSSFVLQQGIFRCVCLFVNSNLDLHGFFFRRLQTLSKLKLTERMNSVIAQSKGKQLLAQVLIGNRSYKNSSSTSWYHKYLDKSKTIGSYWIMWRKNAIQSSNWS